MFIFIFGLLIFYRSPNLTAIKFYNWETSGSKFKVKEAKSLFSSCTLLLRKNKWDRSIGLTAGGSCQPQRKHFSIRLILHKAPESTKEPSSRGHPPWPQVGSRTHTYTVDPWPPWDLDDLPVDVKSNQSKSCSSEGLHPGGWRSNHLTTASKETLAFLNMHECSLCCLHTHITCSWQH